MCVHSTIYLSIPLLMDIWGSTFWLLQIMGIQLSVLSPCFQCLWVYTQSGIAGSHETLCLIFEEPPSCLPQWLYHFMTPPVMHEDSNFSTSSPALLIRCLFIYLSIFVHTSYPNGCEVGKDRFLSFYFSTFSICK